MNGNELKEERERLGYSQVDFAQAIGYSPSSVARWEQLKDEDIPNSRTIELLIKGLEAEAKEGKPKK
ncbi:MAG: helix-turn-helix domain-containing protein [Terriglobia bacterium]